MTLVQLKQVQLAFGLAHVLKDADFVLQAGERVCLIGRNGEGKSSLLKLLMGDIAADGGEVIISDQTRLAMLAQDVPEASGRLLDVVMQGAPKANDLLNTYAKLADACGLGDDDACEQLGHIQNQLDAAGGWELERDARHLLEMMGLDPESDLADLSGGRKRRALLAQALACKPNVLLLDEPTNHLDVDSIEWLEGFLKQKTDLSLLFISHDRAFIDALATRIIELDRGVLSGYNVTDGEGGYARYQYLKAQQLQAEEKAQANFDKKLAAEEVWIRQGIKARRTRNEGRVRALQALREERKARREQLGQVNISMGSAALSGKLVCQVHKLTLAYDDQVLVHEFSSRIMRGDRIGIVGPNGVGKTTLIKAILGEPLPDVKQSGRIELGTNLEVAFFDQLRDQLDLEQSVAYNVSGGSDFVEVQGKQTHIMSYLQDFLFAPERARTPVKALSGGERNRVLLAKQLLKPANVLVLDEPTNDLDMATLELLEEAVCGFDGTILLISHDRAFMDQVVTSTWVFETDDQGRGCVHEYVGGYQDYVRQKARQPTIKPQVTSAKPKASKQVATSAKPKQKLSFNEQRELENLPDKIAALEQEQQDLESKLAHADWSEQDPKAASKLGARLNEIETQLLVLLERWEHLEVIRDAQ